MYKQMGRAESVVRGTMSIEADLEKSMLRIRVDRVASDDIASSVQIELTTLQFLNAVDAVYQGMAEEIAETVVD